jgi:hypothetical protein
MGDGNITAAPPAVAGRLRAVLENQVRQPGSTTGGAFESPERAVDESRSGRPEQRPI